MQSPNYPITQLLNGVAEEPMPHGRIKRLVPQHGFGFLIDDTGMDWFFVRENVRDGFDRLAIKEPVGFAPEWTPTGPRAADIHYEPGE